MLFSSVTFMFIFLATVLLLYFICPRKFKNIVLLIASLVFYAWGEPIYVLIMIVSTIVNYFLALYADKCNKEDKHSKGKWAIAGTIIFNFGLLLFFKYTDFFIININQIFGASIKLLELPLPLGISFYSFQTMSYTIDVYRKDAKVQKNILSLATYVTLFPQLIAGPIVRYQTVQDQIDNRKETIDKFGEGVKRFTIGLGKKVLLANTVGKIYSDLSVLGIDENSVALSWLCAIAFTFQIYFDFSGYSDMAIGLGKMLGFDFLENFNYPYISKSITEFWRRWHISLSSWFRDYVYIPLGGSRKGKVRTYINIGCVWLLTGLWHGASWNFVIWGIYFGILLVIEKLFLGKIIEKGPNVLKHIYALFFVNISWVIFSYDEITKVGTALKNMFGLGGIPIWNGRTTFYILSYLLVFIVLILASTPYPKDTWNRVVNYFNKKDVHVDIIAEPVFVLIILVLSTAALVSDSFNPFLYFRF